jgi:Flp pilus assembly protein TadD
MKKIQVSRSYCRLLAAACLFLYAGSVSFADPQNRSRNIPSIGQVRGAIVGAEPNAADGLKVELYSSTGSNKIDEAWVSPSGEFEFTRASSGRYFLMLKDRMGNTITQQHVAVGSNSGPLNITMPKVEEAEAAGTGTVSVARLKHKPNKKAVKEFRRAAEALEKKQYEEATALLEKAVEIDPHYMEAHTNLGACYLRAGKTGEAIASLRRAVELDPGSAISFSNLAGALLNNQEYKEAASAARTAVSLDPTSAHSRYVLGVALANLPNQEEEALALLGRVAGDFPRARLFRAQLLSRQGQFDVATAELKEYRELSAPEERPQLDLMLMRLEREAKVRKTASTKPETDQLNRDLTGRKPQ